MAQPTAISGGENKPTHTHTQKRHVHVRENTEIPPPPLKAKMNGTRTTKSGHQESQEISYRKRPSTISCLRFFCVSALENPRQNIRDAIEDNFFFLNIGESHSEQSVRCERCEEVSGRRHVDAIAEPDRSRTRSSTADHNRWLLPYEFAQTFAPSLPISTTERVFQLFFDLTPFPTGS